MFLFACIICGCATSYQESSRDGGYEHDRLEEDLFAVRFYGNSFTKESRVKDFCMLRCAEITLEYKFKYFTIERSRNEGTTNVVDNGYISETTEVITTKHNKEHLETVTVSKPDIHSSYRPGRSYLIRCFDATPTNGHYGKVYNAAIIARNLRTKYEIK